ncbi:hypothetical protein QBC38DRAFT_378912 [Podospora fimiseda]|uniref:ZSWIM1/3 RNaseH-like domain-containing protein n=1 Tax=Podospora fimiseda TaxID=252190 RepID=A0AAN6YPH0_9PEZI|nr:hypothetical protein QBC38DRAFT_378912 [Podospora fimiseda]
MERDNSDQLQALVWVEPGMERYIQQYPHVLYIDMTYATNRHNLPFYQATTQSPVGTNLSLFFGIVNNETEDGFRFLFDAIK